MNYADAYKLALTQAREAVRLGRDPRDSEYGIEHFSDPNDFVVFSLPRQENRFGHELRCEVVRPTDPRTWSRASCVRSTMPCRCCWTPPCNSGPTGPPS